MELINRILQISKKYNLSHISSCVTSAQLIDDVYLFKKPNEPFILSNGHAGLALYCVLEKQEGKDAEKLYDKHGTHPNRDKKDGIWCSTGSLGQGLPIALGMALADRMREVYVLTSDGEWAEGSMWEALRIASDLRVANLTILINANGFSAYKEVDVDRLEWQIAGFVKENCPRVALFRTENPEGYEGLAGHYTKA
jgi:transketolase